MFLAFHEIKRAKLRYALLSIIMIAILFLVFFITGLANGLSFADSSSVEKIPADHIVMNEEAEGALINSELSDTQLEEINNNVDHTSSPLTLTMSTIDGDEESHSETDMIYFSVDTETYPNISVTEGKSLEELNTNEVLVAEKLKEEGFKIGDSIFDKNTETTMEIGGFIEDQTYTFLPAVYTSLDLGVHQQIPQAPPSYNAVVYNGSEVDLEGFDTLTSQEAVESMPGYAETQGSFTVMKVFMFVISAFVSSVFFYVLTIQKTHQFGVLKAIGAKTGYISKSIITQVILLTIVSVGISSLAVSAMTQILPDAIPFEVSIPIILGTGALFLLLNLTGSLLSLFKVTKIDPLEALGRSE